MGSNIPTGKGAGRGGFRFGAGRKPKKKAEAVEPEPVAEADLSPKEIKALKRKRVESFRRFARERTLEELQTISDEIFSQGTRGERVAYLMWLSANGFGTAPKASEADAQSGGMQAVLEEIARKRTEEEAAKKIAESRRLLPAGTAQGTGNTTEGEP